MKILMVCLGNICRSPLAEGILKQKAKAAGFNWSVESAGTGSWHVGNKPDSRSIEVAKKNGLDITDQRSRQFKKADFEAFDHIYVMDASNYQNVCQLATEAQKAKVSLILNESHPNENRGVPDPYLDGKGFEKVYEMLDLACDKIIEKHWGNC